MPGKIKKRLVPFGRPRKEKDLRRVIGASVRGFSEKQLRKWTIEAKRAYPDYHIGRALDELVNLGIREKFRPGKF
jgi:hypothetical protein